MKRLNRVLLIIGFLLILVAVGLFIISQRLPVERIPVGSDFPAEVLLQPGENGTVYEDSVTLKKIENFTRKTTYIYYDTGVYLYMWIEDETGQKIAGGELYEGVCYKYQGRKELKSFQIQLVPWSSIRNDTFGYDWYALPCNSHYTVTQNSMDSYVSAELSGDTDCRNDKNFAAYVSFDRRSEVVFKSRSDGSADISVFGTIEDYGRIPEVLDQGLALKFSDKSGNVTKVSNCGQNNLRVVYKSYAERHLGFPQIIDLPDNFPEQYAFSFRANYSVNPNEDTGLSAGMFDSWRFERWYIANPQSVRMIWYYNGNLVKKIDLTVGFYLIEGNLYQVYFEGDTDSLIQAGLREIE